MSLMKSVPQVIFSVVRAVWDEACLKFYLCILIYSRQKKLSSYWQTVCCPTDLSLVIFLWVHSCVLLWLMAPDSGSTCLYLLSQFPTLLSWKPDVCQREYWIKNTINIIITNTPSRLVGDERDVHQINRRDPWGTFSNIMWAVQSFNLSSVS